MLRSLVARIRSGVMARDVAGKNDSALTSKDMSDEPPESLISNQEDQSSIPELFVGRQPIVNNRREIVAYQLLFRSDLLTDAADIHDDVAATGDVLRNTLNNIGLEAVLGDAMVWARQMDEGASDEA